MNVNKCHGHTTTVNYDISLDDIKVKIKSDIAIHSKGYCLVDSRSALKSIYNHRDELENEPATFNSIITEFLTNCISMNSDRSKLVESFSAFQLLDKYGDVLLKNDPGTFKDILTTFAKNCISINQSGHGIVCPFSAFQLLDKYGDVLDELLKNESYTFNDILIEFITNCISMKPKSIDLVDSKNAFKLLDKYGDKLLKNDPERFKDMLTKFVKNCIAIYPILGPRFGSSNDLVDSRSAFQLLDKYGDVLDELLKNESYTFNDILMEFLTNCISVNPNKSNLVGSEIAFKLLDKYEDKLLKNDQKRFNSILMEFLTNCTSIHSISSSFFNSKSASKLLDKYGDKLLKNDPERFKDMLTKFAKNCIAMHQNSSEFFVELLDKYGDILKDEQNTIVKEFLTNCIAATSNVMFCYHNSVLTLLNNNSDWLSTENSDLYIAIITKLFSDILNGNILSDLLNTYGNSIPTETILTKYTSTSSISVINAIRAYVQGVGVHRRINLPPRTDMIVNNQPLAGIAFEVHNFTDGIEDVCIEIIDSIIKDIGIPSTQFGVENLRAKILLIEYKGDQSAITMALNRILSDDNYKEKLESVLPKICAFIDYDSNLWNEGLITAQTRWNLWLKQSFLESANAYAGNGDTISCLKGIYERLFTGFMAMHPAIDMLFCCKNLIKGYDNNILKKLRELGGIVIEKLKSGNAIVNSNSFALNLKNAYQEAIKERIMEDLLTEISNFENNLANVPETLQIAMNFLSITKDLEVNLFINSCSDKIDQLEWVAAPEGTELGSLLDYIKTELQK